MDKLFEYMSKEWETISQAPFTFLVLATLMFSLAYFAAKWKFTAVTDHVNAANSTLKERLHLKSEQMESYKERALKYDEKVIEIVDSTEITLKEKSLDFVKKLREFIERYKREDQLIQENEWAEMTKVTIENDRDTLWSKFNNANSRLSNERNAEYERRFKIDAILLRDELRSRLKNYKPDKSYRDSAYEYPTNYFGFNDVANDIETMAKLLTKQSSQ